MGVNKGLIPKMYNSFAVSSDDKTIIRLGTELILNLPLEVKVRQLYFIVAYSLMLWFTNHDKRKIHALKMFRKDRISLSKQSSKPCYKILCSF